MSRYYRWKGHAETVLEDYRRSLRWLKEQEQSAAFSNDRDPLSRRGYDVSNPTSAAALKLYNSPRYQQVKREVAAVSRVRKTVSPPLRELMDVMWLEYSNRVEAAAELLGISYSTAKRRKKAVLMQLAIELGWI